MKHLTKYFLIIAAILLTVSACQKEISVEGNGLGGLAAGSLVDSLGNCKNSVVKGTYEVDVTLTDSNFVLLNVNFTTQGKYKITSDTMNGIWFLDSGFAFVVGPTVVKLKGKGKPLLPGTTDFVVTFATSTCKFAITTTGGPNNGSNTADYLSTRAFGYITYQLIPAIPITGGAPLDTFRASISPFPFNYPTPAGKTYYKYETTPTRDTAYYSKNGTDYYTLGTPEYDYLYFYDSVANNIEYIYLKDNVAAGTANGTWLSDSVRAGIFDKNTRTWTFGQARLKFTILAVNRTATYFGVTYKQIIVVKREMLFKRETGGTGNFETLLTAEMSYAKGIGLVDELIDPTGTNKQSITIKGWRGL